MDTEKIQVKKVAAKALSLCFSVVVCAQSAFALGCSDAHDANGSGADAAAGPNGDDGGSAAGNDAATAGPDGSAQDDASVGGGEAGGGDAATIDAAGGLITANPGNIDDATQAKLRAGGSADPSLKWLYPYDKTVFPLGLGAPSIQLSGAAPTAYYVQLATNGLRYEGFFGSGTSAVVDANAWDALSGAAKGGTMDASVTILRDGAVTGPLKETWTLATAALPGALYYAALGAPELNGNGAVMKVAFGQPATIAIGQTTCMGCHGVSADGSTMIASYGDNNSGSVFDLTSGAKDVRDQPNSLLTWGALTPDGTLMMSNGALDGGFPPNVSGQTQGPRPSRLYDVKTGAQIPSQTWDESITYALMPAFSPDGTRIAFNHYDAGQGKSLSAMQFDPATKSFSGFVDIAIDATRFLGWPSFTPDGQHVIFQAGSREDYVTEQLGKGDLQMTSSTGQAIVALDALNTASDGNGHVSFWPSVSPIDAGGYSWVAFTSRRPYGNTNVDATEDSDARQKIWIAAIDPGASIAANPGKDPSHPAFLLPGQEPASGNMRPQWTKR